MLTADRLKTILGIEDTSVDATINTVVAAANSCVQKYTGRTFAAETQYTELFENESITEYINVKNLNVSSVDELKVDDVVRTDEVDYIIDNSIIKLKFKLSEGAKVSIKYTTTSDTYSEIDYATELIGVYFYSKYDRLVDGAENVITADGTVIYPTTDIPNEAKKILNRYKRVRL